MQRYGATFILAAFAACLPMPIDAFDAQEAQKRQEAPRKYDVEARLMFWVDVGGRQSIPDQQETITDFLVRRARVIVQGRPSESFSFYLQVGQDNAGGRLLTDDGSIRIKDAYINYRATNAWQFSAGQFKIPFLRANLESGFNQLLVDRGTLPTLRPAREGSRDLGAMAWGHVNAFQYRVAVFDGSDQDTRNTESSLRLSSRLAYNWFTRETGLGYTGTYLGTTRILQLAAQVDVQGSRLDSRDESNFQSRSREYRAWALEGFFEQPLAGGAAVTVDGAWFDRRDDYLEAGVPTRELRGYYIQPGFLVPGQVGPGRLQFGFRHEDWDTERGPVDASTTRTTGGATYYLRGHNRKLQADYTRKREMPQIRNNEFRLSLVLVF